ncbi:MAG: hypothetical protein IJK23_04325 [Clostridia bacterium]|nr:hypothetical protein [Clostridia bacterium]
MARKILSDGIDVSKHNGYLDWDKMKGKIGFAVIRVGYGSDYRSQDDAQYKHNIEGCIKIGIPWGVYLYSYADTPEKAESEAEHAIRLLKGYRPVMPLYYDLEENKVAARGNANLLAIAKAFCKKVEAAGYTFGVYANTYWWNTYLTDAWYNGYSRWVAQYNSVCTYKGNYDLWQYTSKGHIDGFGGVFDMNHCYKNFSAAKKPLKAPTTELVNEILAGKWGNGEERVRRLTEAGWDAAAAQKAVNERLAENKKGKGDIDGDGDVDSSDARKALRIAAGLESATAEQIARGDMDDDGRITSADAKEILKEAAKKK